jgi:hypothetical protein
MNYTGSDTFEWDPAKSDQCFRQRGFDFGYAAFAFADPRRLVTSDHRFPYGEDRFQLLGSIDGRVFVVVYTHRGSAVRIISARKANHREVRQYENRSAQD